MQELRNSTKDRITTEFMTHLGLSVSVIALSICTQFHFDFQRELCTVGVRNIQST